MKKLFVCMLIISCCSLFAKWHPWTEPPKKDQLYMTVEVTPGEIPERRQLFVVTHYDEKNPVYQYRMNGWWDVTKESLWEWCNGGNRLIYHP